MTAPLIDPATGRVMLAQVSAGCTGCGSEDTVVVTGLHGRRCAACPPTYNRGYALRCVDLGQPSTAFAHLRTAIACYPRGGRP